MKTSRGQKKRNYDFWGKYEGKDGVRIKRLDKKKE